jgi:hypothetical protein
MTISRRQFLVGGASGLAFALPLLHWPSKAFAQESFPKRLLVFFQPNGTKLEKWKPTGGVDNFVLSPLLAPLERHRNKLLVIDGLKLASAAVGPGGPHQRGMATVLTGAEILEGDFVGGDGRKSGWGGGISLDQYLAQRLNSPTRFGSLELGVVVKDNNPRSRLNYLGPNQPISPESNPVAAHQRIFGNLVGPTEDDRQVRMRRSALDAVFADVAALEQRVGSADRLKLERYLESFRQIEKRLAYVPAAACSASAQPPQLAPMSEDDFGDIARIQIDQMVAALACDLTRIGTLQFSSAVNQVRFTFLGMRDQQGHALSHAGDNSATAQTEWERMLTWYSEQLAYLLDGLASVPEGDGTLLDNTLVLCCSELGRGNTHSLDNMPFLIAGGAGGALRMGRSMSFPDEPHNNLLVSVLNAMGVEDQVFGDERFCTGPLPGLA